MASSTSTKQVVRRYMHRQGGALAPSAWRKEIGSKLDATNVLLLRISEHAEACQGLLDRGYRKLLGRVPSVKLVNVHMKGDNKTLKAIAKGTLDYDVEILLTLPTPSYCTCPFFARAHVPCKHILALATHWRAETEQALAWIDGRLESLLTRVEYDG